MSDNLLINKYPKIAKEWNLTKNDDICLDTITFGSQIKVWWICNKNHEWRATVYNRAGNSSNCPECIKYYKSGETLLDIFPTVAKFWHQTLNGELKPDEVSCKAGKLVWWQCNKQHEWQQRVDSRVKSKIECPTCYLIENSLGTKFPELVKMWDYDKNECSPFEIWPSSKESVYWICGKGHSSKSDPNTKHKSPDCQYCVGKLATLEKNFAVMYPDLLKFWNRDKNDRKPEELHIGSNKLVYWICEKGHEWQRKIYHIINNNKNNDCPTCYFDENKLSVSYPKIASEWDYEKNSDMTPDKITYGNPIYIWWKCKKQHTWKAQISSRTACNSECPQCVNKGYSKIGLKWLNEVAEKENINIQHAVNGGEHKININGKKIKVDGFCKETNTVYEFLGCLWHYHADSTCNLRKGKVTEKNPINKKYNIDLYMNTIERLMDIEKAGYELVYIWECDYLTQK